MTVPVWSNTQSSASSIVGGHRRRWPRRSAPGRGPRTSCPSYQNERLSASPDASPTSRSGRRRRRGAALVSCCRGLRSRHLVVHLLGLEREGLRPGEPVAHLAHQFARRAVRRGATPAELRLDRRRRGLLGGPAPEQDKTANGIKRFFMALSLRALGNFSLRIAHRHRQGGGAAVLSVFRMAPTPRTPPLSGPCSSIDRPAPYQE